MSESASEVPVAKQSPREGRAARRTEAGSGAGSSGWLAGLRRRLLTAAVLIPIAIALVWFGGWAAFAGVTLALVLSIWELRTMFAAKRWYPLVVVSAAVAFDFLLAAMLPDWRLALIAAGISALIIVSFTWVMLTRPTIERTLVDWALTVAIPFYVGWPMALFLVLRGDQIGFVDNPRFWWVLALFCMVWANDTAAFVTGHFAGRNKLAPHISPAKTREGFVGGLIWSIIAAFVLLVISPVHLAWYHAVVIGTLTAIAATAGDLAESLLKRGTGVKDSGTIMPGHGGLLDRMDSLLFAVIVVFFYAAVVHGIPLG